MKRFMMGMIVLAGMTVAAGAAAPPAWPGEGAAAHDAAPQRVRIAQYGRHHYRPGPHPLGPGRNHGMRRPLLNSDYRLIPSRSPIGLFSPYAIYPTARVCYRRVRGGIVQFPC